MGDNFYKNPMDPKLYCTILRSFDKTTLRSIQKSIEKYYLNMEVRAF